jgi:diketogulonate reductase-like aldo/keto reductase
VTFCKSYNIQVIAHCPLGGALSPQVAGRNGNGPLQDLLVSWRNPHSREASSQSCSSQINYIATIRQKSAAQIILAWIIGQGICVVPKSNSPSRIRENFDVCFDLTTAEQQLISTITARAQAAQRNMVSVGHIGFDTFDEEVDQPM